MTSMLERTNPAGLHQPPGYSHVTVTDAARLVFLAGQCPLDERGQLTGPGDLQAQIGQVVSNITIALSSAGATAGNVLRESPIAEALESASTLLGVSQLGYPGQLVEIDVTAALSGSGPA